MEIETLRLSTEVIETWLLTFSDELEQIGKAREIVIVLSIQRQKTIIELQTKQITDYKNKQGIIQKLAVVTDKLF